MATNAIVLTIVVALAALVLIGMLAIVMRKARRQERDDTGVTEHDPPVAIVATYGD